GVEAGPENHLDRHRVPAGPGRQGPGREVELHSIEDFAAADAAPLVGVGGGGDLDRAEVEGRPADGPAPFLAGDGDVDVVSGLRVLVDLDGGQEGVGVGEVEVLDPVLAALVEVDRPGVGDVEHPGAVDRPHQPAGLFLVE